MTEQLVMNGCPDAETLGAFIDGTLTGEALRVTTEHLATCDECMAVMRAANFRHDETRQPVPIASHRRFRVRAPLAAVAAAIVIVAGLGVMMVILRARAERDGIRLLIAAAPANWRTVEPRLADFPWAELRRLRAGDRVAPDPEALQLGGAAGSVIRKSQNDASASAAHAAGVAELLIRQPNEAIERLRAATARQSNDARTWNDLAAAYYSGATDDRRPSDLPEALAAADRALALQPSFAEALFNRALIFERMGLRDQALAAWRAYLAVDPSSPWAAEARAHLGALNVPAGVGGHAELESAAARGDVVAVERIVRAEPEQSRKWFETEVLGRWGETLDALRLHSAATVGAVLRHVDGDELLADAVAAIERQADRQPIAAAYARYRRGRLRYQAHDPNAEADLLTAAEQFDRVGSPMAAVSRLYAASVLFDENRISDAAAMFERILRGAAPQHRSLIAQTRLQLGRCAMYEGRWSDALDDFRAAASLFRRLGESSNLAVAETGLADAFAGVGNREESWARRVAAFDLLGRSAGPQRLLALSTATNFELRNNHPAAAGALVRLEIEEARRAASPLLIADAYRRSALFHARVGETNAGFADLRDARRYLSLEREGGLRRRVEGECEIADGVLTRGVDARQSFQMLTRAIAFLSAADQRFAVAEALLDRGRSREALGDLAGAGSDFNAAFAELEHERRGTDATGIMQTAASLLEESVDLFLARGDAARAFECAEQVHGRTLLDSSATPPPDAAAVRAALAAGTTLIEYVLVPRGFVSFCVTNRGLSCVRVDVDRAKLDEEIRRMREVLSRRGDSAAVRSASTALRERLINPIAPEIANAASLVIVADRSLQAVPWAALYDPLRGEYLVERHAITVAPSAGVWMRNCRWAAGRKGNRLLAIAGGDSRGLDDIARVHVEIDAVASLYDDHCLLSGAAATPDQIIRAANECDVIHFAGHARGASTDDPSMLVGGVDLRASEIERQTLRRPRLAVLAACSTIDGNAARIDGMSGLARAFLTAGVPAVVGTLWPIEDAPAAALFTEFHRRLRAGASATEALREAQISMIRGGGAAAHPAVWGAAEIVGGDG